MFCPKCGNQFKENERCCSNSGYKLPENLRTIPENENEGAAVISACQNVNQRPNLAIKVIFFALAAVVLVMSLYSAHCITAGGMDISSIESVGGQTLEEAYYQYSGMVYTGYAAAVRATGIFFASVLSYLGIKG